MSDKTYDVLKALAQIWIPMVAAITIGLGEIWHIEMMTPIGATLTLIDTALGVALAKVSKDYNEKEGGADDN